MDFGLQHKVALVTGANNPQDIADTIVFLASERAAMLTGRF